MRDIYNYARLATRNERWTEEGVQTLQTSAFIEVFNESKTVTNLLISPQSISYKGSSEYR